MFKWARGHKQTLTVKAIKFAAKRHKGDKRDDGITDFIDHPVRACQILINLSVKNDVILAAVILHDTVEMKRATHGEVISVCGPEVAFLVDLVSRKPGELLEYYYERISRDIRAILVKAADNLHNLNTMIGVFPADKLEENIKKSEDFVVPMIKKAQIDYPEYREILDILEDRIRAKLDEVKVYLKQVRARDKLHEVFSITELAERKEALLALDSERRET